MKDQIRVITRLVDCELFGGKWETNPDLLFTQEYLETLFTAAKAHDIAPILASYLFRQNLLPKEGAVKEKWREVQMAAIYRYARLDHEAGRVFGLFEEKKIPFIPLKGAVIRDLYPEPYLRTSCDVDVFVREEDLERAKRALVEELGYASTPVEETHHDISFASPGGVIIELHHALIEEERMPRAKEALSAFFDQATPRAGFSYYLEMQPETFMLYHLVHMAKHFINGGCGMRSYIDLYLLTRKFSYDRERFLSLVNRSGLDAFYQTCMDLCAVWFEGKEHDALSQKMETFVFWGGVYGSVKNHIAVKSAKEKNKRSLWLRVIFLPRENLEILYPQLRSHPERLWIYQIRRWLCVFQKDKRKKLKNRSMASHEITRETQEETRDLLQELELM